MPIEYDMETISIRSHKEENMPKIFMTMERTTRVSKEFDVTDTEMEAIKNGEVPNWDEMRQAIDDPNEERDIEYDCQVQDEDERILIDWGQCSQ